MMRVQVYDKFTLLQLGDNFPWGMILIDILTYFLLCPTTATFEDEASDLNWSLVFHLARIMWKRSSASHYKILLKDINFSTKCILIWCD